MLTDSRYALLVGGVLGATTFVANLLYFQLPIGDVRGVYTDCWSTARAALAADPGSTTFADCTLASDRIQAAWILAGVGIVVLLAMALFVVLPALKSRRDRLTRMTDDDAPGLLAEVAEMSRQAGLHRSPTVLWNPLDAAISGQAFGHRPRYSLVLTGGLVLQFYRDRALFRGIVLHELAHLRSGDVDKTYFSIALTCAFVASGVVSVALSVVYAISNAAGGSIFENTYNVVRGLALIGLVVLTLAAVLRARELDADATAARWDGAAESLARALDRLVNAERPLPVWKRVIRVHPSPSQRLARLSATTNAPSVGWWDAFGAGLAACIGLPAVGQAMQLFSHDPTATLVGSAAVLALPLAAFVGIGARRPRARWSVVFGLSLGALLGQGLAFDAALQTLPPPSVYALVAIGVTSLLWLPLIVLVLRGIVGWWRSVAHVSGPLRGFSFLVLAGLLGLWLSMLFAVHNQIALAFTLSESALGGLFVVLVSLAAVWTIVAEPLFAWVVVGLVVVGLAARLRRDRLEYATN